MRGDGSYFHRDVLQWSRTIVTIIFYLEETTFENGCTLVIPGSHIFRASAKNEVEKDEEFARLKLFDQAVPAPMPAGGMLAINSVLMHAAGANQMDQTRISMTVGYHSMDELAEPATPNRVLVKGEYIYGGNV